MATTKRAPKAKPAKRLDRRKTTSTRITPETRGQIEEAAAQSGRSLAQEIEFRLEQSFLQEAAQQRVQDSIEEAFGGKGRYRFLRIISTAADRVEWIEDKRVDQDPNAWLAFKEATMRLFDEFAPARLKRPLGLLNIAEIEYAKALGRDTAELAIGKVKIAIYRQELKKAGVDPDSVDLTESE